MNTFRAILVPIFFFFGVVFALSANTTVWANRTIFNTDNFVETTTDVLEDEEVQDALATRLSVALIERGEVGPRISEALPEGLEFLAPSLTVAASDLAHDIILRTLQNERVQGGFEEALRLVHQQLLRLIEGEGAVLVEDGTVVLDLTVVLERAADQLELDTNVNIELPEGAGQIVLIEDADTAETVQNLLSLHNEITWSVVGLAVLMFALGILVARNRRGALRTAGLLLVVTGLLAVILVFPIRPFLANYTENDKALDVVIQTFTFDYRVQSLVFVLVGALIMAVAMLLGDGEMSRAIRRRPGADWTLAFRTNATTLRGIGLIGGAIVLAGWPDPSTRMYVTTFILIALYFTFIWVMTSTSKTATSIRDQASEALSSNPAGSDRNDSFFGRHAGVLRLAGVAIAAAWLILLPEIGFRAIAIAAVLVFVYLALIEWLAARPSGASN